LLGTIAITDYGWYEFLASRPGLHEVNFWSPSPRRAVVAPEFSPFFFKLRAPHNAICGFAYFARYSVLPAWLAWECFEQGNGCTSWQEFNIRLEALRKGFRFKQEGHVSNIGCTLLLHPTFFRREDWVRQPSDWHVRTQVSKKYDLETGEGARVWQECRARIPALRTQVPTAAAGDLIAGEPIRFGTPYLVAPRLGQGTFRVAVTDAYGRACAATGEHSLPVLDAAHIKPVAENGPHDVGNGLLLRADLHRLFDKGYVTVTPEYRLKVSSRLKQDYDNGKSYYPLHGERIRIPALSTLVPRPEFLHWHNENVFLS
jgi:putative restriction endonuclease